MALITAGSGLAGAGILAGGNLLGSAINGANSESSGSSFNDSSYGYSGSSYGYSDSTSESWDDSYSKAWDQIYGTEASAKDIARAKEANKLQDRYLLAQMDYNAKEAKIARDWQEYMSNTSYQRAVADLAKAGLNPILAAGNYGASTPLGAVANTGLQTAYKAQTYANRRAESYSERHAGSYSESHSESSSSESGGGSSHGESEQSSKSEQQATSLAKAAADVAGKVAGKVVSTLTEPIADLYRGGAGKSAYDHYDMPTI